MFSMYVCIMLKMHLNFYLFFKQCFTTPTDVVCGSGVLFIFIGMCIELQIEFPLENSGRGFHKFFE